MEMIALFCVGLVGWIAVFSMYCNRRERKTKRPHVQRVDLLKDLARHIGRQHLNSIYRNHEVRGLLQQILYKPETSAEMAMKELWEDQAIVVYDHFRSVDLVRVDEATTPKHYTHVIPGGEW